ncbi:hypothetical protein [Acidisoma sp. L85]|uniref:hypothetical protein n=1 Tax=Acidisoma sp. L85 TaxID=1641850 RepID=UPI00352B3543
MVGLAQTQNKFTATDLIFKEIDIRGSFIYAEEFEQAIRLIASGGVAVDKFTTDVRSLDGALDAICLSASSPRVDIWTKLDNCTCRQTTGYRIKKREERP